MNSFLLCSQKVSFDKLGNAVMVAIRCHLICGVECLRHTVGHSYADARLPQHGYIIQAVTKRCGLRCGQPQIVCQFS